MGVRLSGASPGGPATQALQAQAPPPVHHGGVGRGPSLGVDGRQVFWGQIFIVEHTFQDLHYIN